MSADTTAETAPSEGAPRKSYHHVNLRAALIESGLAILAEEGVSALTLRAAARRAGVSHNAPYRHFADKEALLAAIAEEGFDALAAATQAASDRFPGAPVRQLEEAGWAYVQFAVAHPDHLRVMFGDMIPDPQAHPSLSAAGGRAFAQLVTLVQAGQDAGVFVASQPLELALSAWAMAHGLALLLIGNQIPLEARQAPGEEELVRRSLRLQVNGLRAHP